MEITSAGTVADLAPNGILRASINLGNPVLAQGTAEEPGGVSVDIAREIAARLRVPVEFVCFRAARESFEALTTRRADVGFLAVEPARAESVAFTAPYVIIEAVFAVPVGSPLRTVSDVDRPGIRIGVKRGSAYDLYLTRTLEHATLVRGDEGVDVFLAEGLDAGAGIREPVDRFCAAHPEVRAIPDRFMRIDQAVGVLHGHRPESVAFLHDLVEELKASGFVADALRRSGRTDAAVAPPA
jgi:polar amino acid transport system substrate-binding protein